MKHDARVRWLAPELADYAHVPGINDNVTDANRTALDDLCALMDARGLLGASPRDVKRDTVRRLLAELRGEPVGSAW